MFAPLGRAAWYKELTLSLDGTFEQDLLRYLDHFLETSTSVAFGRVTWSRVYHDMARRAGNNVLTT